MTFISPASIREFLRCFFELHWRIPQAIRRKVKRNSIHAFHLILCLARDLSLILLLPVSPRTLFQIITVYFFPPEFHFTILLISDFLKPWSQGPFVCLTRWSLNSLGRPTDKTYTTPVSMEFTGNAIVLCKGQRHWFCPKPEWVSHHHQGLKFFQLYRNKWAFFQNQSQKTSFTQWLLRFIESKGHLRKTWQIVGT